jgi:hypothetical protein
LSSLSRHYRPPKGSVSNMPVSLQGGTPAVGFAFRVIRVQSV